jgi:hypothetical protein
MENLEKLATYGTLDHEKQKTIFLDNFPIILTEIFTVI